MCNGINTVEGEGIYAGVSGLHEQLAKIGNWATEHGQPLVSNSRNKGPAALGVPLSTEKATTPVTAPPSPASVPARRRQEPASSDHVEVICIVRSADASDSSSDVIVLKNASAEFLGALEREREARR